MITKITFGKLLRNRDFRTMRYTSRDKIQAINENEKLAMMISDYLKKQICNEKDIIGFVTDDMSKLYIDVMSKVADIYNNKKLESFHKREMLLSIKREYIND